MELDRKGYSCFKILPFVRELILEQYQPKYEKLFADHVTHEFNVTYARSLEQPKHVMAVPIQTYGYLDSGDGLECFLVEVNGERVRPDGRMYHITWSLDPKKYKPFMSNDLINTQDYVDMVLPYKLGSVYTFVPHNK